MWEAIVVGLIVLAAALYASWTLLPAAVRLRLALRVGDWGRRPGRAGWLQRGSTAVETAARKRAGTCSDCSAVQADPSAPSSRKPPRD
jgi:hypothetical protein